jgi:hypothetical protein
MLEEVSKELRGVQGDFEVVGNMKAASYSGDGSTIIFLPMYLQERSSDPDDPPEGMTCIWMSDGTGSGDDGDVMAKITAGSTTKTGTILDHSAL